MRRAILLTGLAWAFFAATGTAVAATDAPGAAGIAPPRSVVPGEVKATRVVVQVTEADPARWNLVLNNVANLQEALGADKVAVEIVAYGPGIGMLKSDSVASTRIADLIKSGVAVQACENTMRNQKLVHADMNPAVTYVPAGVVEIVKKQQEGWAYLRP